MWEVPSDQIIRGGGWETGSWATSYCSRLPRVYMRVIAGFPKEAGFCGLKRSSVNAPESLRKALWPWVDEALNDYAQGRIEEPDMAGQDFLRLMDKLRDVMLQDSAVLQEEFPENPLWQHEIFCRGEWHQYAKLVRECDAQADDDTDLAVRNVAPIVADSVNALSTRFSTGMNVSRRTIVDEIRASGDVNQRGLASVQPGLGKVNDNVQSMQTKLLRQGKRGWW